ncbi:MAG TPA: DUF4838 domain-containing protein, partial [Actinopolymorphaceae bacterium]
MTVVGTAGNPEFSRRNLLRSGAALGVTAGASGLPGVSSMAAAPAHAATAAGPNTDGGRRLVLARHGHTDHRIYVGSTEGPIVTAVAEELATYLRRLTGARFRVTVAPTPPTSHPLIVVGRRNPSAERAGIDLEALGDDGFALRTFGSGARSLLIAGASDRGTLYGVYWLLDRLCGVRWFAPDHTVVPKRNVLALPSDRLDDDHVPRFRFREVFAADGVDPAYRHHNLLNGSSHHVRDLPVPEHLDTWSDYWPYEAHNFHQVVPDESLWVGGQLKAMDPRTRSTATANLIERIKEKVTAGRDPSYGFSQMDWWWTPDPDSQAFADAHGGALSAPIVDMVNEVVASVRQEIPDARLGTLAYQFTYQPPKDLPVSDHVVVTVAPIEADFAHPLISERNQQMGAALHTWTELSRNVVVWTYNTNFQNYLLPFPNYRAMCESVRQLAARSVPGYFGQAAWDNGGGAELAHLRLWVLSRLLWDPEEDYDALIEEFVEGYYGAGGREVLEYLRLLVDAVERSGASLPCFIPTPATPYLDFQTVRKADALLDRAERKVRRDSTKLRHVRILRLGIDLVILLRRNAFARQAAAEKIRWDPDLDRRIERFHWAIDASGMTAFREELAGKGVGDPDWLKALVAITPSPAPPPREVEGLPETDWVDFQELDFTLWPLTTKVVEDPGASDGYAARMPGDTPDWGVQVPLSALPDGDDAWRLYAVVRAATGDAAPDDRALTVGVYPPFGNEVHVPVSTLADGEYHVIEVPGTYRRDSADMLWVAPPDSPRVEHVAVDRV